jgi:hypothetical protein
MTIKTDEGQACLAEFGRYLGDIGYTDLFHSFPQMPFRYKETDAFFGRARSLLPRDLRIAVRLLALREAVGAEEVEGSGLGEYLSVLLGPNGILERNPSSGTYRTKAVRLLGYDGLLLAVSAPSRGKPIGAYFGDDSIKLTRHLVGEAGQTALDCCCGSGIQSLHLARRGLNVVGVDIQELPIRLARFNSIINRLQDRTRFIHGDLMQLTLPDCFDVIVSNPPLLPIPNTLSYDVVGHGGEFGWKVTEAVLDKVAASSNGVTRGVIVGMCLGTRDEPEIVSWAQDAAARRGMSLTLFLGGTCSASALNEAMAVSSWFTTGARFGDSMAELSRMTRERNADRAFSFVLKALKDGDRPGKATVVPLYRGFRDSGTWYVT